MRFSLKLSVKIGNMLFKNMFPVYNFLYPVFKKRQDKNEIFLIKKYVKPGNTVLDIGANIGFYSQVFSNLVAETGYVYAFEPDPLNFKYLRKNTSALKNIQLFNKAVSNKNEILKLYRSPMLNVDHRTYPVKEYTEIIEIEAIALDLELSGKVDFIKIDIQGAEYHAFLGMEKLLDRNPHVRIITEFFPEGLTASGASPTLFFDFFLKKGFRLFKIDKSQVLSEVKSSVFSENSALDAYWNLLICREL